MKTPATTWSRRAARLAELIPLVQLHPAVLARIDRPRRRTPWVVALSGGADSVALLLLLWAHWPERRPHLRAVHFNHRLRGRASDRDEAFCRTLCRALDVPLAVGRRRLAQQVRGEAQARELRFGFIDRCMQRHRAKILWLGHQQNDVAESLLMRLARGSGAGGLAAPRPVQSMPAGRMHLRPLLNLKHAELESALRAARVPWREDASNQTGVFFRNRIRHNVLPVWTEAAGRDALAGAALSRDLLEEDDAALDRWAHELHVAMPRGHLLLARLSEVPRAVVRRLLHRWLGSQPKVGELSRQAFEQLLDAVQRGEATRHSIGAEAFAVIRRHELHCEVKPRKSRKSRLGL